MARLGERARPAERLLNRELSWLDFNARVLELAEDPQVPLLERVKFCSIFSSNLDEFFMVRVGGLMRQAEAAMPMRSVDGQTPQAVLARIRERALALTERQSAAVDRRAAAGARGRGHRRRHVRRLHERGARGARRALRP